MLSPILYGGIQTLGKPGRVYLFVLAAAVSVHTVLLTVLPDGAAQYVDLDIFGKLKIFGGHMATFVLGYLLGSYEKKIPNWLLVLGAAGTLAVISVGTWLLTVRTGEFNQNFQNQSSGFEIVLAACIFLLCKQTCNRPPRAWVRAALGSVVSLSMAIYLMHNTRKIFSYSAYQFLFNVINYFSRNLDKLLIGKYMSMSDLGYYEKSYRLMMLPLQNITQVITPVMHPIFSDFQNDKAKLATSYERILRFLAFIGLPLSVLLFFTAEEVTLIIFGVQWLPSVPVFRLLSLSVGIQIILSSSGSIFQAAGDTRSLFVCGVFSSVLNVTGILLGIFYFGTLTAVASCIVVTFSINFIQCYWQMYRITFRRSAWPFIRQLISPFIISILIALALIPMQYALEGMNIFVTIIAKSIVSFIIFGIYIQMTHEYDIIGKVRSILCKR